MYAQTLDSESSACARFPAQCPGTVGREAEALAARQRVAEAGATLGSAAAASYLEDRALRARVEEAILECVKDADYQLNERYFGGSPTREQSSAGARWRPCCAPEARRWWEPSSRTS